ncbi:hypothetical protein [Streptomyces sp. NEAU-YJ-81]|uniref:hypothetical protein n=1 Tax=Streptomyces sp. NEAU-YJ-81 TaxID=2820288 RepID=UPI001ABC8EE1|nr:hypothetical protein [Streptomyces sp. NEAU-YJ-81]MBO3681685.1 hypothetical protein [Streptomyces sp. NEAU-YJ-81]
MRTHHIAVVILAATLPLAACSSGDDDSEDPKPRAAGKSFDCTTQDTTQAEWMEHCADKATESAEQSSTGLTFGKAYRWPDGLEVSVTSAKVVTEFGEYDSKPDANETGFRVELELANKGKAAVKLDDLSLITEGATNGGEAASTTYDVGSEPLEGRLAPGITVTKNDDEVLETKYGKKIVVTVQRASENLDLEFPEFSGTIQ